MSSWPQVQARLRVIRSEGTYTVRRQLTEEVGQQTSDWIWVTTLSAAQLCTEWAVRLGHQRWDIENHGFKELVQDWHADHVYKHDAETIQAFLLMTMLAYNLISRVFASEPEAANPDAQTTSVLDAPDRCGALR